MFRSAAKWSFPLNFFTFSLFRCFNNIFFWCGAERSLRQFDLALLKSFATYVCIKIVGSLQMWHHATYSKVKINNNEIVFDCSHSSLTVLSTLLLLFPFIHSFPTPFSLFATINLTDFSPHILPFCDNNKNKLKFLTQIYFIINHNAR